MTEPTEPTFPPVPEELLVVAAPQALAWSRELCRRVNPSGRTCAAYHGIWQYLRLLGIINPPWEDVPFFREAFGAAARRGQRRVLVAGCADYAMPAVVQWSFALEGAQPDLTVLDYCETPLRLNEWYAERHGGALRTVACDLLDYRPERPFDIVCTHSLFGLFSPTARHALIARWQELLVPGGIVVTVNRIAPGAPDLERFTDAQALEFRERVRREALAQQDRLQLAIGPEELAALADGFVAQNVVHAVRSESELVKLFESGGFRIESLAFRSITGAKLLSGPTQGAGSTVVQLVAARR
jgi:hypothetical protein